MSKVSVIMPVYNAERHLERTLESLINQTFDDYEIVCINDGSKDNSLKILEKYSEKSNKIKIINQKNSGPAMARHNGIKNSSSKYLMFCDADDKYCPTMIEEMYNAIEENQTDFAMCLHNIYDLKTEKITQWENKGHYKTDFGKFEMTPEKTYKTSILLWDKIIKRDLLETNNIEYPISYEHDDAVFMIRYFSSCKNYFVLNKFLYLYTTNNVSSIMGKLRSNKNGEKCFDFIYSYYYLFEYFKNNSFSDEEYKYFFDFVIGSWKSHYIRLTSKDRKKAQKYIIEALIKYKDLFYKNENLSKLIDLRKIKDFNKIFNCDLSFMQKIFSVVNMDGKKF